MSTYKGNEMAMIMGVKLDEGIYTPGTAVKIDKNVILHNCRHGCSLHASRIILPPTRSAHALGTSSKSSGWARQ